MNKNLIKGHFSGITYVTSKEDDIYFASNSKD